MASRNISYHNGSDIVAEWGREISILAPKIHSLSENDGDIAFRRLSFLSDALSQQPATTLDGALAQCVRLVCEIDELVSWIGDEARDDVAAGRDRALGLAYSIIRVLEGATGRRRDELGGTWSLSPGDDPFGRTDGVRNGG